MTITSKFEKGDTIWFYYLENNVAKFLEGTIEEVQSWDKFISFRYYISHYNENGMRMNYYADEKNMYSTKQEAIDAIFRSNSQPAPNQEVVIEPKP